jgi:hypothetical protein
VYLALKLHYVFAFRLVQKTSISEAKKQKIEKIKTYVFGFLNVLFVIALIAMVWFGTRMLMQGESLKEVVLHVWLEIPDGFWFAMLWKLIRIAILIVIMRYILRGIYILLERHKAKVVAKKCYNTKNIEILYLRIHNTIKFTVILGVMYRIIHFFPFLAEVSRVFFVALVLFVVSALIVTLKELILMLNTRK